MMLLQIKQDADRLFRRVHKGRRDDFEQILVSAAVGNVGQAPAAAQEIQSIERNGVTSVKLG